MTTIATGRYNDTRRELCNRDSPQ